ncbi:MAG: tetratricopeptide repeat protein [Anaerolineae bacterium]|nr:tetratricopeptide repeat protein [Anaerolineae bacterium]
MKKHIFISYASADRAPVERLHERLKAEALPMWIDNLDVSEGLKAGQPWREGLAEALQTALAVVWVASPASMASPWVRAELQRTLELGKPLIPLVLDADFEQHPGWQETRAWQTQDGYLLGDLQRIVPAVLGEDLAYRKLVSQLYQQTQSARISGFFPSSQLDVPISGREVDLRAVEMLLREERRLVVLMALGGTGKTRLAAEIAARQRTFQDGVVWHRIESHSREIDLSYLIRDHLRLPVETNHDEVWEILGRCQVLIVLDNAESCTDIPNYARRLEHYGLAGGTRVLMTSRVQWRETRKINHIYELPAPDLKAATQIAHNMARQQGYADKLIGQEQPLAEAARCHPRLIQYAMGWLHDYEPTRVLTMLRTLKGGEDVEEALEDILHQTLRQIEASVGGEKAITDLKRLLVCRGGFTSEAAEAILSDLASLSLLRRWNLLHRDGERYQIDTLVEAVLAPDETAHPAHYEYYKALAEMYDAKQDYAGLDVERDNLEVAFQWAMNAQDCAKAYLLYETCDDYVENRGRFDDMQAWIEAIDAGCRGRVNPAQQAYLDTSLGNMLVRLRKGDRLANLKRAIAYYEAALVYRTPTTTPIDYAETQRSLGTTYWQLSEVEARAANLKRAIACFEETLTYHTPATAPMAYAMAQNNLGTAYIDLAEVEEQVGNLKRAIACFEIASEYYTPTTAPLSYAMTQSNLGLAYEVLAGLEERETNLRRALAYLERASEYYTPVTAPLGYAMVQNNLGNTYWNLAKIEERAANLKRAITCYEEALVYHNPTTAPLEYAMTQANLGSTYQDLAEVEEHKANFKRAIACYQEALIYGTSTTSPLGYGAVQNNLGQTYAKLAKLEERTVNLKRAIACYEEALVYRTSSNAPLDYAATQNNLGLAYWYLADVEERGANLNQAVTCYEEALIYCTPTTAPLDYARAQHNLGLVYRDLKVKEKSKTSFQEAEKYYRLMGEVEKAEGALAQINWFVWWKILISIPVSVIRSVWKEFLLLLSLFLACAGASLFSVMWSWSHIGWAAGVIVAIVLIWLWWRLLKWFNWG